MIKKINENLKGHVRPKLIGYSHPAGLASGEVRGKECLPLACFWRRKDLWVIKKETHRRLDANEEWVTCFSKASGYISNQMSTHVDTGACCLRLIMTDGWRYKEPALKFKVRWDGENVSEGQKTDREVRGGRRQMVVEHKREWQVMKMRAGKKKTQCKKTKHLEQSRKRSEM